MIAGPQRLVCIDAQSADESLGKAVAAELGFTLQTYVIHSHGVTSSGVITIEEASWAKDDAPYDGTWSTITTVNASDVNTGSATGSAQKFVHISATAGAHTRARISTAIGGGGTISVFCHQQGF